MKITTRLDHCKNYLVQIGRMHGPTEYSSSKLLPADDAEEEEGAVGCRVVRHAVETGHDSIPSGRVYVINTRT